MIVQAMLACFASLRFPPSFVPDDPGLRSNRGGTIHCHAHSARMRSPRILRTISNFDEFLPATVEHTRNKDSLSTAASSTSISSAGYRLAGSTSVVDGVLRTDQGSGAVQVIQQLLPLPADFYPNLLMLDIWEVFNQSAHNQHLAARHPTVGSHAFYFSNGPAHIKLEVLTFNANITAASRVRPPISPLTPNLQSALPTTKPRCPSMQCEDQLKTLEQVRQTTHCETLLNNTTTPAPALARIAHPASVDLLPVVVVEEGRRGWSRIIHADIRGRGSVVLSSSVASRLEVLAVPPNLTCRVCSRTSLVDSECTKLLGRESLLRLHWQFPFGSDEGLQPNECKMGAGALVGGRGWGRRRSRGIWVLGLKEGDAGVGLEDVQDVCDDVERRDKGFGRWDRGGGTAVDLEDGTDEGGVERGR
ncbi:hypothetical protein GALMADRAFT_148148 [Galerina marginata CBS 339.88]|uniref:Uncharacterized protein n=1 Tax=Galerina marginata (strain CBS 339.88) TaxID=685588 RepID=A0A067S5J8_GALM3|nr:hypothetical protein GALMADRAFT_148148 [Galerina marginata CBS 339.88]